jgi:hypothetical protein
MFLSSLVGMKVVDNCLLDKDSCTTSVILLKTNCGYISVTFTAENANDPHKLLWRLIPRAGRMDISSIPGWES